MRTVRCLPLPAAFVGGAVLGLVAALALTSLPAGRETIIAPAGGWIPGNRPP